MRKLTLSLEALQVESFEAGRESIGGVGTVRGNAKATYACTDGWAGCPVETIGQHTCNPTCQPTDGGISCDNFSCLANTCGAGDSCETCSICQSFLPCTDNDCVFPP
jgi:hypothetical protein